jgi:homocysteine S-methyltransferase
VFLDAIREAPLLADGGTGSLIFEGTGRPSETRHVYEAFSLDNPDLVRMAHHAYLQAGAQCITTNTFEANRTHLEPFGERDRLVEINRAAVRVARESIRIYQQRVTDERPHFVLASLGPTRDETEPPGLVREIYGEQIEALLDEGVDALLFESFTRLPHLMAILELLRERTDRPPVVVQMSLFLTNGQVWDQDPRLFVNTAAELGADVVGVNGCAPWEAIAFLDAVEELPPVRGGDVLLSSFPTAGRIHEVNHRHMTGISPEIIGKFARTVTERGVRLVGGDSEVHPPFIHEMHAYLQSRQGRQTAGNVAVFDGLDMSKAMTPAGASEKGHNGTFSRRIVDGEFAVSVEMIPARGTSLQVIETKAKFVRELVESGLAHAVDVTDGSRGIPLMPPGDFIQVLRDHLGWTRDRGDDLELIPHFTSRDLNLMGVQSRLIGYHSKRIRNVLLVTGDPPKMSPTYPRSTGVFDLDSVAMIRFVQSHLNSGVDFGGQPLGKHEDPRTAFTIGTGFMPEALNIERETDRLRAKIDAGADYVMTQPVFHLDALEGLAGLRDRAAMLAGVMILMGLEHASRVGRIPGVVVPEAIYERLSAHEGREDQARVGQEIAAEQIRQIRSQGWAGLYLMSPASHRPILPVLQAGMK